MNSRQLRKIEASQHNMLRIEQKAYAEDRLRYPKKFRKSLIGKKHLIMEAIINHNYGNI